MKNALSRTILFPRQIFEQQLDNIVCCQYIRSNVITIEFVRAEHSIALNLIFQIITSGIFMSIR